MQPDLVPRGRFGELLRALTHDSPPPYDYAEFSRRIERRRRTRRTQAIAATAVLAVSVAALFLRLATTLPSGASTVPPPWRDGGLPSAASERSAPADHDLAVLSQEPAVARLGTRAAVTRIEDRIAQLDDVLSAVRAAQDVPPAVQTLQQERARLMGTLVQVRSAENLTDQLL